MLAKAEECTRSSTPTGRLRPSTTSRSSLVSAQRRRVQISPALCTAQGRRGAHSGDEDPIGEGFDETGYRSLAHHHEAAQTDRYVLTGKTRTYFRSELRKVHRHDRRGFRLRPHLMSKAIGPRPRSYSDRPHAPRRASSSILPMTMTPWSRVASASKLRPDWAGRFLARSFGWIPAAYAADPTHGRAPETRRIRPMGFTHHAVRTARGRIRA